MKYSIFLLLILLFLFSSSIIDAKIIKSKCFRLNVGESKYFKESNRHIYYNGIINKDRFIIQIHDPLRLSGFANTTTYYPITQKLIRTSIGHFNVKNINLKYIILCNNE